MLGNHQAKIMITYKDLKKPHILFATWFGCGLSPKAPGTIGSIGTFPFAFLIFAFGGIAAFAAFTCITTVNGFWASTKFEQETNTHDSKMVVIDEVAGQSISLMPAFILSGLNPIYIILAFPLFRFFDIIKPWPVSYFDKQVKGALGVMGDDIVAGILAALCLWGIIGVTA